MITPTYDWQVNTDEPSEDFVKLVKKTKNRCTFSKIALEASSSD